MLLMKTSKTSDSGLEPTHTVEDYLMRMYVMERDQGEIVAARLAELLEVAQPTVAITLRRMERDGYISGRGRKSLHLTETGLEFAKRTTRRHMLVEWLLVRTFGVPMKEAHHEAHGIEHAISPLVESKLIEMLDNPKVCPHGNPLPDFEDFVKNWTPLIGMKIGEKAIVKRIHEYAEDDEKLLDYLIDHKVIPGTTIELVDRLDFNQTCTIKVGENLIMLGFHPAKLIFVSKLTDQ